MVVQLSVEEVEGALHVPELPFGLAGGGAEAAEAVGLLLLLLLLQPGEVVGLLLLLLLLQPGEVVGLLLPLLVQAAEAVGLLLPLLVQAGMGTGKKCGGEVVEVGVVSRAHAVGGRMKGAEAEEEGGAGGLCVP